MNPATMEALMTEERFSRRDFYDAYEARFGKQNKYALEYALRKAVADGSIFHVGRDQYAADKKRRSYVHKYSEAASGVAAKIQEEYPSIDFRIFELTQMNAFVNHLFAHNTIFVSVENDMIDFVFDTLRGDYPGRVMLKPRYEEYNRYLTDDQIVVLRLPSEAPKGTEKPWNSRLEKILVDITVDKLLSRVVSGAEYNTIFTEAFERYLIDQKTMMRYAKRKGAGEKFKQCLEKYLQLHTEEYMFQGREEKLLYRS